MKFFKLFLSCVLILLTIFTMLFFRGMIVRDYWEVSIETTGTEIAIRSNITLEKKSKEITKNIAVFQLDEGFEKFTLSPQKEQKISKIFITGANGKKNYSLNKELSFSISEKPIRKIYPHRIFLPLICLIWLIWGIWYKVPNISSPPPSELYHIDFLRILFIFVIVFCHIFNFRKWWNIGGLGCEFFFILSGFFMYYHHSNFKPMEWIKKNIIKFMPLMVFTFLLFGIKAENFSPIRICAYFLFSTHVIDAAWPYSNVPWFICVLFWCSLFYQQILSSLSSKKAHLIIGVIVFISYSIANSYKFNPDWYIFEKYKLFPIPVFRGLASIGAGYFLGILLQHSENNTLKQWKYTILEVFFLFFTVSGLFVEDFGLRRNIYTVFLFLVLIALFIIQKGGISNFLDKKIFYTLSRYVLSLYLVHILFVEVHLKINDREYILLALSCAIAAAIILHHLIELPSRIYLAKILGSEKNTIKEENR